MNKIGSHKEKVVFFKKYIWNAVSAFLSQFFVFSYILFSYIILRASPPSAIEALKNPFGTSWRIRITSKIACLIDTSIILSFCREVLPSTSE